MGHLPRILIWEISSQNLVSEFSGHKFGVFALIFSPNNKYLISLGFQHDGYLCVWDWRSGEKLASNKLIAKVYSISFSRNGYYCVTAGLRFLKFWYFDMDGNLPSSSRVIIACICSN